MLHLDLLKAALLPGDAAVAAWGRWREAIDLDRLDAAAERLLPLAAYHLKRQGLADASLGRYAQLSTFTWVTNQRRMARVAQLVASLRDAGIPTMLLKGMALAVHYYPHPGLRPMDDIDLLVRAEDAARAAAHLAATGWRADGPLPDLRITHAQSFQAGDGAYLDLHWRLLWELVDGEGMDDVWRRSIAARLGQGEVQVPAPTDLFLHVVVHGARWSRVPAIRWVADAMAVLSHAGASFDWPLLVDDAIRHDLVLPLRDALRLLAETFGADVPASAQSALAAHRPSRFARVEHWLRGRTSSRVGGFPLVVCHHVRLNKAHGPVAVVAGLPRYLQSVYGVPTPGAVPAALLRRAVRRLTLRAQ